SYLQKRLERQRDLTRKSASSTIDFQPKKSLLARNRLSVPGKGTSTDRRPDEQPLVSWQSDSDEEEEFNLQQLSQETRWQIQQQLIKDGYNLDTLPDDEDLDLIPPRPLQDRCTSCCENATHLACSLQ
ncbi:PREDICTED: protein FAM219A-like, partial [Priapulus caudatus]|uniref:Protein FAM219A-like n=1 Tax=Priapulus caudatus TaxID=37621 RepID=A0ABM1F0U2_PRICU